MKTLFVSISIGLFLSLNLMSYSQNSNFEEDVINKFGEGAVKSYDLLHAINYDKKLYKEGKSQLNEFIYSLESKKLKTKPIKKQIQTIYKSAHSKFLKKYEAKAYFNDIFKNGYYNCVTASALYALIFDEFNISYAIKETPTHVYLIADTLGLQTLIETTLPGTGPVIFNEKFKKDYVAYLNDNKIISNSEFNTSTLDELFSKFYSEDKSIKLNELAALQYYNKGIFLMEEEKYSGATTCFEKALKIYPSNNIKYNHFASIQNALYKDYQSKNYNGDQFGHFLKASAKDSSLQLVLIDYFANISQELCANKPDLATYNKFYDNILSICPFDEIPVEIKHNYHYYKAYNYGINSNYPKALSEIKQAYDLRNDDLQVKELATNLGMKHLFIESGYKNQIDSMEFYFQELPFFVDNKLFQQQFVYYYMKVISNGFMYDAPEEGNIYYNKFLKALDKYNITQYSEEHISFGIGYMAYYYAEENNFERAFAILEKGLELAPNSLRLKQLEAEMKNARQFVNRVNSYKNRPQPEVVYVDNRYSEAEELKENVDKHFPGKWKAVSIVIEDTEQNLTKKEIFEFNAQKNKSCTYSNNGKTETGKWAYRTKSRCIYFVPNHDKDKYKVFKVKEASANKLILLPYKDQKTPSPYKYILKPVQ